LSFLNCYELRITEGERIQIKNESNFSSDILKEFLSLRPIEVAVRTGADNEYIVSITAPQGITAAVLNASESGQAYYADIENQFYQRLVVNVESEQQSWFITHEDGQNANINSLYTQPIVLKCFTREDSSKAVLFAANKQFKIARNTTSRFANVVHDPSSIPESVLRLVDIVDEPLPEKRVSLELLIERLNTTIKVLQRFQGKRITLKAKEDIDYALGEVEDYLARVNIKIEESRYENQFDALLFQKMAEKLKQTLGGKRFEKSMAGMYRELFKEIQQREKEEKLINNNELYDSLLDEVDTFDIRKMVKRLLDAQLPKHYFAHSCSKCGSDAIINFDGTKKHFIVCCSSCKNTLENGKSSKKRTTSVGNWNRANPIDDFDCWLTFLGLEPKDESAITDQIKKIIHVLMNMLAYSNTQFQADFRKNREFVNIQETVELLKAIKSGM
tara:strand:+ start:502 stop:1836 length:1335 start_codon:yes stop_codon:yes gene_type:complete